MRKGRALMIWQCFYSQIAKFKRWNKSPKSYERYLMALKIIGRYAHQDKYSYLILNKNVRNYLDNKISISEFRDLWLELENQIDEINLAYEKIYNIADHIAQWPEFSAKNPIELVDSHVECDIELKKISSKLLLRMTEVDKLCFWGNGATIKFSSQSLRSIRKAISDYTKETPNITKVKGRKFYKAEVHKDSFNESEITLFEDTDICIVPHNEDGALLVRLSYPINLSVISKPN